MCAHFRAQTQLMGLDSGRGASADVIGPLRGGSEPKDQSRRGARSPGIHDASHVVVLAHVSLNIPITFLASPAHNLDVSVLASALCAAAEASPGELGSPGTTNR